MLYISILETMLLVYILFKTEDIFEILLNNID